MVRNPGRGQVGRRNPHRTRKPGCLPHRSGGRSGRLERKGEERGQSKKDERHEIIPREFLFQEEDRESGEDEERDNLLNDLELESRSEEHTSELQSLRHLVCRLLLEKKKQLVGGGSSAAHTSAQQPPRHLG